MSNLNKKIELVTTFFPIHLLFSQVKFNLLALFYWLFLFLIISDQIGSAFGIPYLFHSPEYMGQTSFLSFLFLGFSIGGFTMGFNTYSFIRLAPKYPFLNTLNQPFYKFCLNNALLPIVFNLYFIFRFSRFQWKEEYASLTQISSYVAAYLLGFFIFQLLSALYFFPMNKRAKKRINSKFIPLREETVIKTVIPNREKKIRQTTSSPQTNYYYLGKKLKIFSSRSSRHYNKEILSQIYRQNKVNATLFETLTIVSFLSLGWLQSTPYFEFPAAVSIVLLITIILMLISSLLSYLQNWAYPVIILLFLLMNYMSIHSSFFNFKNYAYGLNYHPEKKQAYTIDSISALANDTMGVEKSKINILQILENWKLKTKEKKPKLILVNVSGGGSRSALWVMTCLQQLNDLTKHDFYNHVHMVTGASGGMIGASYYRQLHSISPRQSTNFKQNALENISADLLNRLSFSASTNDIFFRYKTFSKNRYHYPIDRGRAFEEQLTKNTKGILDIPLSYYVLKEKKAVVPLFIFTPTIVNDGRRMLISSQSLQFLMDRSSSRLKLPNSFENIDYQSLFSKNNPNDLGFTSILRMSATFPFVMPMVTLPTTPEVQLMDAGIRDNYGGKITIDYIFAIHEWIEKNTSGVVIVQIRDTKKILKNEEINNVSLIEKFTLPFGNMYSNFPRTQDFDQDALFTNSIEKLPFPIDVVSFNLRQDKKEKISLSWHLTQQEKLKIKNAFTSDANQIAASRLLCLLKK